MRFLPYLCLLLPLSAKELRVATFNVSLAQDAAGELAEKLADPSYRPAQRVAGLIQVVKPDIILLNEFDFQPGSLALTRFQENFLSVGQDDLEPQSYPFRYAGPSNTGISSGFDLDNNGDIDTTPGDRTYGGDAFGFGEFEGKFGMALLSKYPLVEAEIKTFESLLWREMPESLLPDQFYSEEEREVFRISSKSHWDIPINIDGQIIHILASHPTPPVFDGPEDRNGRRNHDEIRLWSDYLSPDSAEYLGGSLPEGRRFVILGDQNADPTRGESIEGAIQQVLDHPRVNSTFVPERSGRSSENTRFNTSTFGLRVDYVLPSKEGLKVSGGAVFWPRDSDEGAAYVTVSDHRLVYLDLEIQAPGPPAPELEKVSGGLELSWPTEPETRYDLELSPSLMSDSWETALGHLIQEEGNVARVVVPFDEPRRFARLVRREE